MKTSKNFINLNHLLISLISFFLLFGCDNNTKEESDPLKSFKISNNYRAWQGVTIDDDYIYVFSDRNENFGLENIISIYTHDGKVVKDYKNIYTGTDMQGNFMSFGDGNMIDGYIYVTAYNVNSGGSPLQSQILVYSTPDIKLIKIYEIGDGVAESVTKYMNSYWITYYDKMIIKQFDTSFNKINTYALSETKSKYGGYQGAYWENDNFFLQMHGPNKFELNPSKGLDKYRFDGNAFIFLETQKSLGYGAGQGVAIYGKYILQNDRPDNGIVIKKR